MPTVPGPSERSANMRANKRRDTGPERRVRRLLHQRGLRFRVDLPIRASHPRPIRPDIAFTRARIAVFIDGCFWHGCPDHGRRPNVKNAFYWGPKIAGNAQRDSWHTAALEAAGWTVLRFWEHQPAEDVAREIADTYQARMHSLSSETAKPIA
jgi:DNA mismatch endonuclease (patch repair protein)